MKLYQVRALFTVLVRYPVHTPFRTLMYGLPLSQSDQRIRSVFQSVYNNKHLLTDCAVSAVKYSDRNSDPRTEQNEMQMKCKTSRLNLQAKRWPVQLRDNTARATTSETPYFTWPESLFHSFVLVATRASAEGSMVI